MSENDFQYRPVYKPEKRKHSWLKKRSSRTPQAQGGSSHKKSFFKRNWFPFLPPLKDKHGRIDIKQLALRLLIIGAVLFLAGVILIFLLLAYFSIGLPDVNDLERLAVAQSTTIYDREGNVLYVKHGGENRQYIPYDQISPHLINATVAIEDDEFWNHSGFDLPAIAKAFFNRSTGGPSRGGSTITQQYVKNTYLTPEQSYSRKIKELILASRLEQAFSKEKILELYLNKIPYGNNAYGAEKAAQIYFAKNAKELTVAESAILASLPNRPSYYDPYGEYVYSQLTANLTQEERTNRNIASQLDLHDDEFWQGLIGADVDLGNGKTVYIPGRSDLVLRAMEKMGNITPEEHELALNELHTIEFNSYSGDIKAAHFVFYVLKELEEKYGPEVVEQGGLNVYTTIDPDLQDYAEEAVKTGAERNTDNYNVNNAALISLDPQTGEILAMVGSKGYFAEDIDGKVNMITRARPAGSSFKPIVFAQAFYNRFTPATVMFDVRTRFGSSTYPNNYDGRFMGPMSIRRALAQSRNIPAIKAYFLAGEQDKIIDLAEKMGIKTLNRDIDYGWPLALGSGEVLPIEIASAFSAFANNGIRHEPVGILRVENSQGEIWEQKQPDQGEEVLDPQIAYLITNILSDPSVGLGGNLLVPGKTTAAKTGTSTDNDGDARDLWTIGYTPNIVTAVWTGNNTAKEGKPAKTASGFTNAAPIWKQFMTAALEKLPNQSFDVPEGITTASVSRLSGKLAGPDTPPQYVVEEVFASFSVPTDIDDSITTVTLDTRNMKLANEYCPPNFVETFNFVSLQAIEPRENWQEGVDAWLAEHGSELLTSETDTSDSTLENGEETAATPTRTSSNMAYGTPPSTESELCSARNLEDAPKITIRTPKNKEEVATGATVHVQTRIRSDNEITKVEFYLDDQFKYTTSEAPYTGTIRFPKNEIGRKRHIIRVEATDILGYISQEEITVYSNDKLPPEDENTENSLLDSSEDITNTDNADSTTSTTNSELPETPTEPSPADLSTI